MAVTFVPARQKLRNTTGGLSTKVGFVGLFAYDITKKTGVVFDGETEGGFPLAREDLSNIPQPNSDSLIPMNIGTITADATPPLDNDSHGLFGWIKKIAANLTHSMAVNGYIVTCDTAGGTTDKALTISNFKVVAGTRVFITFTYKNTVATPTLNFNSGGANSIYNESGAIAESLYFPAGCTVEFYRNSDNTKWVYKRRVIKLITGQSGTNYTDGWYKLYNDGWVEQGALVAAVDTVALQISMKYVNQVLMTRVTAVATSSTSRIIAVKDNSTASTLNVLRSDSGFKWGYETKGFQA